MVSEHRDEVPTPAHHSAASIALVVDVDGVVSPLRGRSDWGDDVVAGWAFGEVLVSPELCRELDALTARGDVRGVWLTDWEPDMRAGVRPFPGASWEAIERPGHADATAYRGRDLGWWKSAALLRWLDEQPAVRSVIWLDDHLAFPHDPRLSSEDVASGAISRVTVLKATLTRRGITSLLIAPEPTVGLTRADMHRIEEVVRPADG